MRLAGDHVEAGLEVQDDVALGKDSKAVIKVATILGSRYLALEPKEGGSLPNNTFDLAHTEVPYDLQAALADVTTTYEQVDTDAFAKSLGDPGPADAGPARGGAAGDAQHPDPVDGDRRPARPVGRLAEEHRSDQFDAGAAARQHRRDDQPGGRS